MPVYRLWGLDPAKAPRSTFTIGLDTPERIRLKVREAAQYPILKIKLGTDRDVEILRTIRDATDKEIRVDANCGWTVKQAIAMLPVLAGVRRDRAGAAAAADRARAAWPRSPGGRRFRSSPTRAAWTRRDIPPLVGAVDGINIKLAKCGSLREALRMIAVARAHGMMVMVGCMIESSLGITAAAHFTPLVDIVDLDGAALLAADPFVGATHRRRAGDACPTARGSASGGDDRRASPRSRSRSRSLSRTPTAFPRRWATGWSPAPASSCRCAGAS